MSRRKKIMGHRSTLSGDRSVWLGKHPDGGFLIEFKTGDQASGVRLSEDALGALVRMYAIHHETKWNAISEWMMEMVVGSEDMKFKWRPVPELTDEDVRGAS